MKINYLLIGLFFISIFGKAQDAGFSKKSMKANFSMEVLNAYQESSFAKVNDFYEYTQLLTNPTISSDLKNEIKTTIFTLFKEKDVTVVNFLSSKKEKITLTQFLNLLENEKSIRFQTKKTNEKVQFFNDYWINHYYLEIERNKQIMIIEIKQKVYFSENLKSFGENQKEVWSVYLGEME
ncbi:hypothetical protein M0M57_14435 [Flavobacterium azooxidireducens]|uniref:DUF4252 domain-containing protein n=1 Tax=Flavobacterium azooxidireducens TaxID=1871076 RepID=A0ABY4KGF5_9FLAO|nr:hypothetical protein [Flavobacterium azooxidireducens]UPQ78803.1 hypothetical protein M0M57_14435 [Flavobacterium azooxidireducens]